MAFLQTDLVEIRACRLGRGLFAMKDIPAHTVICSISGSLLSFAESIALGDRESHALQIDKDKYILCDPPFLYSNHSCDPNCAITPDLLYYTLHDIAANQELVWDYSTSMLERHWQMKCSCGSACCRGIVTDFDLLPQKLQQKYINMNMALPFIISNIGYQHDECEHRA
jgi:SET domain-containing protein